MNQTQETMSSDSLEKLIQDANLKSRTSLKAKLFTLRYRFWLASIREISLIITLVNNFEKVPKGTPSYHLTKFFVEHVKMKKWLFNLEKRLRSRIY